MASSGGFALVALGVERKVDHHDGVLLHDADEQDDADERNHAELGARDQQREQRADAGRGQRGDDGDGVDVALVEHAQHDVDGDQRGQDQQRLVGQRGLEGGGRALEAGIDAGRHLDALLDCVHRLDRIAQRLARREVEADHRGRELALVPDGQLRAGLLPMGQHAQRNLRAVGRLHVEIVQRRGIGLEVLARLPSPRGTGSAA